MQARKGTAGKSAVESCARCDRLEAESDRRTAMDIISLTVVSAAFALGDAMPAQYTCEGANVSPPLSWSAVPAGTKSIAVLSDDPDCPGGWVHWVLINLPPEARELPEDVEPDPELPDGSIQGITDFRRPGYGCPCPPPGRPHRYFFRVYALDKKLDLSPRTEMKDVQKAMAGHILAQGETMGRFGR